MFIVENRKIFFLISGILVAVALGAVAIFNVNFGIDFVGGTIIEVNYPGGRPDKSRLETRLDTLDMGVYSLRPTDDTGYLLRTKDITEEEREEVMDALSLNGGTVVETVRLNRVGPVIGQELRSKAFVAMGVVVLMIILFVAFAFRKVSEPVSSWRYGLIAIIALLHDVIIPFGVFAVLGYFFGAEVDILFVMALLAILGYSVNDTIVVFDRVRENLKSNIDREIKEPFEDVVGRSLNQTFARSINTSLTTLFVLVSLFILGGEATQNFALVLIAGVLAGTYSSLFLATPLLVAMKGSPKTDS